MPTGKIRNKRALAASGAAKKSRSKLLSFSDLEIPVEPLLTREKEHRGGRKIRLSLNRLAVLLPRHPAGYRRFLARMEEVIRGGGLMFSWLSLKDKMDKDLGLAFRAMDRAEALAHTSPARSERALQEGVRVLAKYPLDPETLYQWSREAVYGVRPLGELGKLKRTARLGRVLKRVVQVLERERDRLVMPNFRLVLKEVFRYHPTGMKRSDLFQEGILGLQKAVFRFDAERGIRFSTYRRQSRRSCGR
jgi:hypothetical protein